MAILLLSDDTPNYMMDPIYDGLCALLGDANVIDYPRKALYHIPKPTEFPPHGQPRFWVEGCWTDNQNQECPKERLLSEKWDAIVVPSWRRGVSIGWDLVKDQLKGTPVIRIDEEDVAGSVPGERWVSEAPQIPAALFFQREPPYRLPWKKFPLSFPHRKILWRAWLEAPSQLDLFFGGRIESYNRHIGVTEAKKWPIRFRHTQGVPIENCHSQLSSARAGLSLRGGGWDTFRLWETLAHARPVVTDYWPFENAPSFVLRWRPNLSCKEFVNWLGKVDHTELRKFSLAEATGISRARTIINALGISSPSTPQRKDSLEMEFVSCYSYGLGLDVACRSGKVTRHAIGVGLTGDGDIQRDATILPFFPDGVFDYVVASHAIEYLNHPAEAVFEWLRVIRKGGVLVVVALDPVYQSAQATDSTCRTEVFRGQLSGWASSKGAGIEFKEIVPGQSYGAVIRKS
jgi:hypothetical protein